MKALRLIGIQAVVISVASILLAHVLHFPNWHLRPPEPFKSFAWLLGGTTLVIIVTTAWLTNDKGLRASLAWTMGFLLVWWWTAGFLWVNTYGS